MGTTVAISNDHQATTHHARRRAILILTCLLGALAVRSAASASPAAASGSAACREVANATTIEYITGVACPPEGFAAALGYEPVLEQTPAGIRYTRPEAADGGCSGTLGDEGPFWDFGAQCRAHDYAYDLVRFGVGSRTEADAQLQRDMKATCSARGIVGRPACRTVADSAHAVLWVGDVSPGFEPTFEPAP